MSAEPLRELLEQYKTITGEMNNAIDAVSILTNQLSIAKATLSKTKNQCDLVREQIMVEKKLIDAAR